MKVKSVANAVIAYTRDVCSTAMAMYAGRMPEVFQPINEHFDPYRLPDYQLAPGTTCSWLAQTLEDLFCRRTSETWMLPAIANFRGPHPLPSVEEKRHIIFKWRCIDPGLPESRLIRDVFDRHDVTPLVMVRRSVGEQALKIVLADKVYNEKHPQFAAAKLSPDEYARYLHEQSSVSVTLSHADKIEAKGRMLSLVNQTEKIIQRAQYYFPAHQRPLLLMSEDVFRPLIDRDRHFRVMQRLLGSVTPLGPDVEIRYRKAGLDMKHCVNASEFFADAEIAMIERQYGELLAKCELIQFAPEKAP